MKRTAIFLIFALSQLLASAQEQQRADHWYIGISGGARWNKMYFSDIDKNVFTKNRMAANEVVAFSLEANFGREGNWGLMPTVAMLKRGGLIKGIFDKGTYYRDNGIDDVRYRVRARYVDVRLPLFYQFGQRSNRIRPYVYVAPTLGIATGGHIRAELRMTDGSYEGHWMEVSKANMAETEFALAAGMGAKFFFNGLYLAIEGGYEYGFTDTYGSKEKDGKALVPDNTFYAVSKIRGTRRFGGIEAKATLGIPFSAFCKHRPCPCDPTPQPMPVPEPVVQQPQQMPPTEPLLTRPSKPAAQPAAQPQPEVEEEEKPCYTLEEICMMLEQNVSVYGKTICAAEDIQFETAKSTIMEESFDYLNVMAEVLKRTGLKVEIKGHTDNVGSVLTNMKLSQERAIAVMDYLVQRGVDKLNMTCSYYGMSRPIASNDTEEGRRMNRRVEFELK